MLNTYADFARQAREAVVAAAAIVEPAFRTGAGATEQKADGSFVTATDLASQDVIAHVLNCERSGFGFYAEESELSARTRGDYTWIVDPIDGTHNFHFGVPLFAIQVALEHNGQVVAAAMALPAEGLVMSAARGGGAEVNGETMRVSRRAMADGLLLLETRWSERDFAVARALKGAAHDLRVVASSCVSLAYIALGRADMLVDWDDKPWDLAAGTLLVEEAGGTVTDLSGGPFRVYEPKCLASNGVGHSTFVARIAASSAFDDLA